MVCEFHQFLNGKLQFLSIGRQKKKNQELHQFATEETKNFISHLRIANFVQCRKITKFIDQEQKNSKLCQWSAKKNHKFCLWAMKKSHVLSIGHKKKSQISLVNGGKIANFSINVGKNHKFCWSLMEKSLILLMMPRKIKNFIVQLWKNPEFHQPICRKEKFQISFVKEYRLCYLGAFIKRIMNFVDQMWKKNKFCCSDVE